MPSVSKRPGSEPAAVAPDIVTMSGVQFAWPGRNPFALTIDSFSLPKGRRILLIGPSGSGKSTFLSLLCGIVVPQQGKVEVLATEFGSLTSAQRDRFRAEHFGIIFQMFNLLPYGSVTDNILLPLHFSVGRRKRVSESGTPHTEAKRLLTSLGLADAEIQGSSAANLSVGQQQRVAAARALIGRPELIVADEPTSSLDRNRQAAFLDLLFAEVSAAGSTLIMVSHDETLATRFDEVRRLDEFSKSSRSITP
jgi:putative ABC transport system ATP-binding protein